MWDLNPVNPFQNDELSNVAVEKRKRRRKQSGPTVSRNSTPDVEEQENASTVTPAAAVPGKRKYDRRMLTVTQEGDVKTVILPRIVKGDIRRQYFTMFANVLNGMSGDFPWFLSFLKQFGQGSNGNDIVLTKQMLFAPTGKSSGIKVSKKRKVAGRAISIHAICDSASVCSSSDSSTNSSLSLEDNIDTTTPMIEPIDPSDVVLEVETEIETKFVKPWPPYQTHFGPHPLPTSYENEYVSSAILPPLQHNGICLVGSEGIARYWGILAQIMPDLLVTVDDVKVVTRAGTNGCYLVSSFSCIGTEIYDLDYYDLLEDLNKALSESFTSSERESAGERVEEGEGVDSGGGRRDGGINRGTDVPSEGDPIEHMKGSLNQLPSYFYDPIAMRKKISGLPVAPKVSPLRVQGLCYMHINEHKLIKAIDFRVVVPSPPPSSSSVPPSTNPSETA